MTLPIAAALPELLAALESGRNAVLQAPPGAGKTTGVPVALLDQPWLAGKRLIMLEPRRLAARAAARRMANMLGEAVGDTVGYRIRLDSKVGPGTRIEVVTEGILTRMLQADPGLEGVGAVLFDEFHERSLNADLGLALCLEAQAELREDLRLVVMSATLDGGPVAGLLGGAPMVTSEGRAFGVEVRWLDKPDARRFEDAMAAAILRALDEVAEGDLLAFLPGQREIHRVAARLAEQACGALIAPLFGDLPQDAQDAALLPHPGRRKLVLATSIAETSLTIEGVRVVVDGGLMRVARFDANGGMTRLDTLPVSKASAEQRRGRAGRVGPGVCYRLWSEAEHRALPAFSAPEIAAADLAPLALDLARWGVTDPARLSWLDLPPAAAFAQARELLRRLQAIDDNGRITPHGRAMAELPLHPRLAHMVLASRALDLAPLACLLAALLSERDVLRGARDADLRRRVEAVLGAADPAADRAAIARVREGARQLRRQLRIAGPEGGVERTGLVLAFAYPDRIALRRTGSAGLAPMGRDLHYRLSNGRGAYFQEFEPLAGEDWLAVAELDGDRRDARIFLAAPLQAEDVEAHFGDQITTVESVAWDPREQAVAASRRRLLGLLPIAESRLADPPQRAVTSALLDGIRSLGLDCLPWSNTAKALRQRLAFLRTVEGSAWPDVGDAALLATLETWLAPWLAGMQRRAHLERLDLAAIVAAGLSWEQRQVLDREAPTHLTVPSGSRIPIDYGVADTPVLAVRLQEMFGLAETPRIAGGRVPLLLHLLSPARRPVQVTGDLAGFWANSYKLVKSDLKGQYPKHPWPDNPLAAEPTARAKPRTK